MAIWADDMNLPSIYDKASARTALFNQFRVYSIPATTADTLSKAAFNFYKTKDGQSIGRDQLADALALPANVHFGSHIECMYS